MTPMYSNCFMSILVNIVNREVTSQLTVLFEALNALSNIIRQFIRKKKLIVIMSDLYMDSYFINDIVCCTPGTVIISWQSQ